MKQEVSNKMKPAEECTSLKKASDKLKANAGDAEVIDVPEGDPIFLFSYAVGRTRPINVFYDSGCQGAIKYGRLAEFLPGNSDIHRKIGLI